MGRVRFAELLGGARALLMFTVVAGSVTACDHDAAAPQLPEKLRFTEQPQSATAGAPLGSVAVTVVDASGQPVAGVSDTVTLAFANDPGSAAMAGQTTVIAAGGVATFTGLSIAAAGSYELVATAPGFASATSAPFTISPGAAARLAFLTLPSNAQGQVAFSPAVQVVVQDTLGNTVTSATVSVTVALGTNPYGGTLSGTATAAASGGVATFNGLSIDNPGSAYTLTAASGTLKSAVSASFAVHVLFASVGVGDTHNCAVTPAGTAYCWGDNRSGQLGTGTTSSSPTPVAVRGGLRFASVVGGSGFTCGLTTAGAAYCWGSNAYGQLGNGGTVTEASPTPVSGGLTFESLSSNAGLYACGLTAAGAAYCWGLNNYGQLGNGTTTNSLVPVAVSGGLTFSALSVAFSSTCALTASGLAYCWGNNASGQLGNGTTTSSTTPVQVTQGSLLFASLSLGEGHACAVASLTALYCWGDNSDGEFGNGTTTGSTTPVVSAFSSYLNFTAVAAGSNYTCGVAIGGAAYCWGKAFEGQLGDGSMAAAFMPVAVLGGLAFTTVVAGTDHTCSLTAAGTAYCWGYNGLGELGNGVTGGESLVPVPVSQ